MIEAQKYSPLELGMGRLVDAGKGPFVGRAGQLLDGFTDYILITIDMKDPTRPVGEWNEQEVVVDVAGWFTDSTAPLSTGRAVARRTSATCRTRASPGPGAPGGPSPSEKQAGGEGPGAPGGAAGPSTEGPCAPAPSHPTRVWWPS